jgi:hypothetical protein
MNRALYFPLILFVIISTFSCDDNNYEEYISGTDSLLIELNEAEEAFWDIDSVEVVKIYEEIVRNIKFIHDELHDTITPSEDELLSNYRNIRKPFHTFINNRGAIIEEIIFMKGQLITLRRDIKSGKIERNKVEEYFVREKSEAEKLLNKTESLAQDVISSFDDFYSLHPQILEFIDYRIIKKANHTSG